MSLTINMRTALGTLMRLSNRPLTPWLAIVAQSEEKKAKLRIQVTKRSPDGKPWPAWQPPTARHRRAKGTAGRGLLYDEGLLLANVIHRSNDTRAEIGVASAVEYAPYLQNGTSRMAARPYLGWDTPSLAILELDAAIYLSRIR